MTWASPRVVKASLAGCLTLVTGRIQGRGELAQLRGQGEVCSPSSAESGGKGSCRGGDTGVFSQLSGRGGGSERF